MDELSASSVGPETLAEAHVNTIPPGYVERFTEAGVPVLVREGDAASVTASLALLEEQYDLDAAEAEFVASHAAAAEVVGRSLAEFRQLGFVRDESYTVLNLAQGRAIDAYRNLMRAVGGSLPSEALVQSVAEAKATQGHLDNMPRLQRFEAVAARYAAPPVSAPVQDASQ